MKSETVPMKKRVGITSDMTVREREQEFNQREQLMEKKRRRNGEQGWRIINDQLIRGEGIMKY